MRFVTLQQYRAWQWRMLLRAMFLMHILALWPVLAPSIAQSVSTAASSTTTNATTLAAVTTGNLIVVRVSKTGANAGVVVSTITDTQGNAYLPVVTSADKDSRNTEIWQAKNVSGHAGPTVTVTMSGTTSWRQWVDEVAGASTTSPVDVSSSNTGTSVTTLNATATSITTAPNVIVYCVFVTTTGAQTFTAGSGGAGYTLDVNASGRSASENQISAGGLTTAAADMGCSSASNYSGCVASFKADAGGTQVNVSDTGAGSDADPSIAASFTSTDSCAGADGLGSVAAAVALSESCAASEALSSLLVSLAIADAGASDDSLIQIAALLGTIVETCSGTEVLNSGVIIAITDAGTGADGTPTLQASLTVPETCTGNDLLSAIAVALSVLDSSAAIEGLTVQTGSGTRVITITFIPSAKSMAIAASPRSINFSRN